MHTTPTSKLLAVVGNAALLLLWMALLPFAYAGQATDPAPLSASQPRGDSRPAPAVTPTAAHNTYLPLVIRSTVTAASPTPTRTPTTVPTAAPGAEGALFMNRVIKTNGAKVAVDGSGGIHLTYVGSDSLYYAYCAVNCSIISNWSIVSFNQGNMFKYVELQLTTTGHPRLLILGDDSGYSTHYWYAACDTGCSTSSANWTTNLVVNTNYTDVTLSDYSYFTFALDPQDHPRFIYRKWNSGTEYYVFCNDADCAPPAALWYELVLSTDIFSKPSLSFTSNGHPRLATLVFSDNPAITGYLLYGGCDTACDVATNWWYLPLYLNSHSYVLRLTTSDQPRIAFYQGTVSSGVLYYLSCNTGCTNGANWSGWGVGGLTAGNGQNPDLALDGLNRPRIVYREDTPDGLGYAWCTANCELNTAVWQVAHVESGVDLDAEWDILPPLSCSTSAWYAGYRPSIALDASGNPRIGSEGKHLHWGGSCSVAEDFRSARVTLFNQP
jgi:hypothetical protein